MDARTSSRTAASRRPGLLGRAGTGCALALPLAYGGTFWLQILHTAEGGHEPGEPGLLAHWLRDGTLALPGVLVAVVLALHLMGGVLRRAGVSAQAPVGRAALAGATAIASAVAFGLGSPIHGHVFNAHHGGHELSFFVHMLRDGTLALTATLLIAALIVAVPATVWRALVPAPVRGISPRAIAQTAVVVAVVAPVGVTMAEGVQFASAGPSAGQPCPTGSPVKRFTVQAVDVDIPLNRFGDHDPSGKMYALAEELPAIRAQEKSQKVSIGLRDDPIQPLVVRANLGDCVEIDFTNNASGGEFGMHIDGLSHEAASSGDAIGRNAASSVVAGATRTYRYYVPKDPELEGTHYIRPGPGNRTAVSHGLFGALSVEPAGSVYLHPDTRAPLKSGWEAIIAPEGKASFREYVKVYHEIGDEKAPIMGGNGAPLPTVDPITDSYRPGSRGINYRSEPFMHRLQKANDMKSLSYNSYTFGDPATPMMRAYVSDPTKIRIMHAGSEMFHVYHLHGGGIRWPQNPYADKSFNYAAVGLDKHPHAAATNRLDSQSFGPGESYTLQIEGGAGGVQRAVGDLLEHCHIAEHYVSGMWSFWRVFNTRQQDLAPLPDRTAPPTPVDSAGLIGRTMADGTTINKDNLGDWLSELLPPQGKPQSAIDGSVWDWSIDTSDPTRPVYLGEPEDASTWPNLPRTMPGHPSGLPGDRFVADRPVLLFNPVDGRPAYPLLRPHIGQRSPQTPNGHSGTPFLGGRADAAPAHAADAWANRPDGLCPAGAPQRTFNVTTIQLPIQVTAKATDPTGKIFVLSKDIAAVRAGDRPAEPLAIRANIGDCVSLTLTSEFELATPGGPLPRSNLHIHHVQFDPQGSDGASAGMVYDQSVLPYRMVDPKLTAAAAAGDTVLHLADVTKFQKGVPVAVGEGTDGIEVRQITAIDAAAKTITLDRALKNAHPAGEWAGTEFTQLRWYPDVELDNVFWHDHVDGIHGWGKGLVGQLIVEPKGSTYHDPRTGAEVESGTIVDIRTPNALAPGLVDGAFRELALWTIDDNPVTDSTLNLRAAPWADRLADDPDPSLLFSSWRHGDPNTPLPRAYRGDPFVMRSINISGNGLDSLRLSGHRFYTEPRYRDAQGRIESTPTDSIQYGISQRFTAILEGGAGGTGRRSGDFLYHNGIGRRFRQGAWGLLRVMPSLRDDLQPLPGTNVPSGGAATPAPTGGRPPVASTAGNPCPAGAPARTFEISAVDVPRTAEGGDSVLSAFVPTADAAAVARGTLRPEPLALHAAAGECVTVKFTNSRAPEPGGDQPRASFHVAKVAQTVESSGVNAGFNPEQTVAPGDTRTSRFFMDSDRIGSATIADFGGNDTGTRGLYGALVVAPAGATFGDPATGKPRDIGTQVDVTLPNGTGFRDFTLAFAENDPRIGSNTMPYPTAVSGPALVNYRTSPRADDAAAFSSQAHGDPTTPVLQAYAGDPVKVHVIGAPGSEQPHSLSLGGQNWYVDPLIHGGNIVSAASFMAWSGIDADLVGGAGGVGNTVGDFWYGDLRRPFAQAGMWGLMRVLPWQTCTIKPLAGLPCGGDRPAPPVSEPGPVATPTSAPGTSGSGQSPTSTTPSTSDDASGRRPRGTDDNPSRDDSSGKGSGSSKPEDSGTSGKDDRLRATLRDLVLPRRISLATFRRGGLEFWITTPADTRALEVRLVDGRRRTVARGVLTLHRGGTESVLWRLSARDRGRLRAGRYRLVVRGGTSAARLRSAELTRNLDVSGAGR